MDSRAVCKWLMQALASALRKPTQRLCGCLAVGKPENAEVQERTVMGKALLFGGVAEKYLQEWGVTSDYDLVRRKLGILFEEISMDELMERYDEFSVERAEEIGRVVARLIGEAGQGDRCRPDDVQIMRAAGIYITMREMIRERGADACSILCNCRQAIGAVPCVPLVLLQEEGIPAACQGDLDALATMMLLKRISGWTSFMGGPSRAGSYLRVSHCVLSRRMAGPGGPLQPYYLADYHNGRMNSPTIHTDPTVGNTVTCARLTENLRNLILGVGTIRESVDLSGFCRNSLSVEIADVSRLLAEVKGVQNHIAVASGDHVEGMIRLAEDSGIEIISV